MNCCPEFEERLLDYDALSAAERASIDAHVAACAGCVEFRLALARADAALENALGSAAAPLRLKHAVMAQVRPSALPEVLDGIGWIGVAAMVAGAAYFAGGPWAATLAAGAGSIAAAALASIRSFRALRS